MKKITKNLIVSTFAFAFLAMQPGIVGATGETSAFTVFNTDNVPTAQVSLGVQGVSGGSWSGSQTASTGDIVTLKIRYKNTGNWDATNTKIELIKTDAPGDPAIGSSKLNVKIFADNTSYPATGQATVSFPGDEVMTYVAGSLAWYPNQSTVAAPLPFGQNGSEIFNVGSGLNIGVIKSKFSCPSSNPNCREGFILAQFKVSNNNPPPLVSNLSISSVAASNITQTGATLNASFANASGNSVQVWFQYGPTAALGSNSVIKTVNAPSGNVAIDITGLNENSTYYFRAVAKDSLSVKNASNTLSFVTTGTVVNPPQNLPPTVNSQSPSSVTQTSAVLRGRVNPNGSFTTAWFEYGTSDSNLNKIAGTQNVGNDTNMINVSIPVSDLAPNTTYFYRTVASNSFGTVLGSIVSFKTENTSTDPNPTPNAPKALTSIATSIGATSAKLNGLVVLDTAAQTKAWFEYGKTIDLGRVTVAEVVGSNGQISFAKTVSDLSPNTIYFYRTVAENSFGISRGEVMVFKTASSGSSSIGNTGSSMPTNSLISLKVSSKFSEVAAGDIIDLTVSYKALARIEDAVLRISFPEGIKWRKATSGVYSKQDNALIVEIGNLAKDESREIVVQIEITNKAKNEDILAVTALMTFDTITGSKEDAIAYGVLKVAKNENNLLGAAAFFGENSFLPDTLLEWLILLAALVALVLLGREIYFRAGAKKDNSADTGSSNGPSIPENLPTGDSTSQIPVSRYASR